MFDDVVGLGDRLAALVAALDPGRVGAEQAARLWRALDRVERLAAAGKTVLARRAAQARACQMVCVREVRRSLE